MIRQTIKDKDLRYIMGTMLADFGSKRYSDERLILYTDYIVDFLREYCRQCKQNQEKEA